MPGITKHRLVRLILTGERFGSLVEGMNLPPSYISPLMPISPPLFARFVMPRNLPWRPRETQAVSFARGKTPMFSRVAKKDWRGVAKALAHPLGVSRVGDVGSRERPQGETQMTSKTTSLTDRAFANTMNDGFRRWAQGREHIITKRARDARANGEGMGWGQESHTLAEAAADMGATVLWAESDGLLCELSDRLYLLSDVNGPWAVEVATQEDLSA